MSDRSAWPPLVGSHVDPWLVIDGHEQCDADSPLVSGAGDLGGPEVFPPYRVFDANAQIYLTHPVDTLERARRLRSLLLSWGAASRVWQ